MDLSKITEGMQAKKEDFAKHKIIDILILSFKKDTSLIII